MSKQMSGLLIAVVVFLAGCSSPSYFSNAPGLKLTIVNPIAKAMAARPAAGRFIATSSGQTITVTVSGNDIANPITGVASPNGDGSYSATLDIPIGSNRTILVRAYDSQGNLYASVNTTMDLMGGTPAIKLQLQPDAQNAGEVTANGAAFTMHAGGISIYKRTITASEYQDGGVFGLYMYLSDESPFLNTDFFSIIDGAGNIIYPPQTLSSDSFSYFYKYLSGQQDIRPYEGTFYLILWGETDHLSGTIATFPVTYL